VQVNGVNLNPHPIGVYYINNKWSIFNTDQKSIPEGAKFTVQYFAKPDSNQFVHIVTRDNWKKDISYIDHPGLNNNPNAHLELFQNWSPAKRGGLYFRFDIKAKYDSAIGKWYIASTNKIPVHITAAYNIVISSGGNVKTKVIEEKPDVVLNQDPKILTKTDTLPSQTVINDVDFDNWGFEKGLSGWTKEGTAFDNQPTWGDNVLTQRVLSFMEYNNGGLGGNFWKDMGYPLGHKENYWIGTYENHPAENLALGQTQGDALTGRLVSPEFKITKKFCDFLLGGGKDQNNLAVELQVKRPDGNWELVQRVAPFRIGEEMYRAGFLLETFIGKIGRISILDNSTGNWGHINVDDFRFLDQLPVYISITDKQTGILYHLDADAPVWGFADTHAHPTHQEGFGRLSHF
jgi:hypothetical protein